MRPLPFEPVTPVSFDEENATWFVAFIAAINTTVTYLEATSQSLHAFGRSVLTGLCGIAILLVVGWIIKRNIP